MASSGYRGSRSTPQQPETETITTKDNSTLTLGRVIEIDERKLEDHLGRIVRGTVEDTLNALVDAEADALCGAARY